jgi:DNA-binding GntR family transcriptional regulator
MKAEDRAVARLSGEESPAEKSVVPLVGKPTLKVKAYEEIKTFLFCTEVSGQIYSERQLAAHLKLSLGPVRSAVERLRAEGMIQVIPNSGIILPELTADLILDFYEVRSVLEAHIVESLASREVGGRLSEVDDLLARQEACVQRQDATSYHQLDMALHLALAELHGNAEIVRVLVGLRDRMHRLSSRLHAGHPERLSENFLQHRAIVDAIRHGDVQAARERLSSHLSVARNFILDPEARRRFPRTG